VAVVIGSQALAIVWAQWRSLVNYHGRSRNSRFPIMAIFVFIWYGLWTFLATAVAITVADPDSLGLLRRALPGAMLMGFIYWQIVPIIMVSTGVSLDLMRLLVYPIPHVQLFTIEVLLRVTTCIEMLLLSSGLGIGILLNPQLPAWGAISVVVFACFNLFVSAGLKDLLGRLLVRRGFREGIVFLIVLLAALPQLILVSGTPSGLAGWLTNAVGRVSPWGATARLSLGAPDLSGGVFLVFWTFLAWYFGRTQFERTLSFDAAEAKSKGNSGPRRDQLLDVVLRFTSRLFRDPLAALVEKEIRFLSRSARFRLLFLMGFSFGLLIWLPMAARRDADSFFRTNYLTIVSAYALMLLGEVCFWNNLGLDRSAAQAYFTMPISMSTVLKAKNIAAAFFILVELSMVSLCCTLLRMPVSLANVCEAFAVTLVLAVFLMSFGNMLSVRYPRPVDPAQSWRTGSVGRSQAFLLFLYPAAAIPIGLAFGAQFAFESSVAFYGVLLLDFLIGLVVYSIALESSVNAAERNKEFIVLTLSKAEGPVGS
jgi:ABC-2 type transport system permease protein